MNATTASSIERWQRVAALLEAALQRDAPERGRYLEKSCRGQPALKADVESLLARAVTPSFLDSTALAVAAPYLETDTIHEGSVQLPEPLREVVIHAGADFPATLSAEAEESDNPYVLERTLGRGGMATVYVGRDVRHERRVAVKVLDAKLAEQVAAERFIEEIRLTARLQHPHVLALLDSGVFERGALRGRPYYVMPYAASESLRARLARGPLAFDEAARVLREIADALSYAHEQGVIHRDIKPENILLTRGHAVVADFGIAKALVASQSGVPGENTDAAGGPGTAPSPASSLLGTPAYMAPEQAVEGMPVDHRADLYAWGLIAYELLGGRHPFERRASAHELIAAHRREVPPPLSQIAPDVRPDVAALVMQCLAKRPAERPAAASEILTVLDAPPASRTSSLPRASRRRLEALITLGLIVLVGVPSSRGAQPVFVTATGDAAHDVAAIQAAVGRGGDIILEGHFSFAVPPTKPVATLLAAGWYPAAAEILISRAVNISGVRDARGEMTTIESGTVPFYVDAPGERVTIDGVRFVRPTSTAILVHRVRGLEILHSSIEGIVPFRAGGSAGITITTRGGMEMLTSPGNPESVSGHVVIANNVIDGVGGTAREGTAGVNIFSIGQSPGSEVRVDIVSNQITNTTAPTINMRGIHGTVRVLGNTLQTSPETVGDVDAVRLVSGGAILMASNTVECSWPNAAGIQVYSPYAEWPTDSAKVEDNEVHMSPPSGAALGAFSAGISVRGFARGTVIRHNTISGRARAALSMYPFRGGAPADIAFIDNRLENFESTLADIFVGSGVARGHVVGAGSMVDHGTATTR